MSTNCGSSAGKSHESDPVITAGAQPIVSKIPQTDALLAVKDEEVCITIFRSVMRAHHSLLAIGSCVASDFGLHIAQLNVIDMLGKLGPITMGALSQATFISPANTTHTVKKLELAGLVRRKRCTTSERRVMVSLTAAGKQLFAACYPQILMAVEQNLEQRLNARERTTLAKLLEKLAS